MDHHDHADMLYESGFCPNCREHRAHRDAECECCGYVPWEIE